MKQKMAELKGEIGNSTVLVGNFNILLSMMKRINRQDQQGSRRLEQLYKPTRHTNIYRTLHPIAEYTFFLSAHGTFTTSGRKQTATNLK